MTKKRLDDIFQGPKHDLSIFEALQICKALDCALTLTFQPMSKILPVPEKKPKKAKK
jgi:hypothetical protein